MKNDKCGVYQIRCWASGKIYIGSSYRIYSRWSQHRTVLRKGTSTCLGLQNAWNKYGEISFVFSILEECERDQLELREQYYIDTFRPDYNMITRVRERLGPIPRAKIAAITRARAAAITHCPHGHLYDEANTYINKEGTRICRACNALRVAAIYANETEDKREKRLQRDNANYYKNYEKYRQRQNDYAVAHRAEKRAYDQAHKEEKREYDKKRRQKIKAL